MQTVNDIVNNSAFTLIRSQQKVNAIYEKLGKEIPGNRSLFVKFNITGRILEAYEYTGYVPVPSRELRKVF